MNFYARIDVNFVFVGIEVINLGGPCEQQRTIIG